MKARPPAPECRRRSRQPPSVGGGADKGGVAEGRADEGGADEGGVDEGGVDCDEDEVEICPRLVDVGRGCPRWAESMMAVGTVRKLKSP